MFLLFSSDSSVRYLQDVLDATAYPRGHVIQFRYNTEIVGSPIAGWKVKADETVKLPWFCDRRATLVYAERDPSDPEKDFSFIPFRHARVVRLRKIGDAYYVDLELGGYPSLQRPGSRPCQGLQSFREFILRLPRHPLPRLADGRGLSWQEGNIKRPHDPAVPSQPSIFMMMLETDRNPSAGGFPFSESAIQAEQQVWEEVVESLGSTREFASCTFFRLGAVRRARPWGLRWLGGYEVPVGQKTRNVETEYQLPAGKYVVLSCRSYRPRSSDKQVERSILVSAKGDGFVGAWPEEIRVDSRYNEQRVILACKRVLDAIMSPVSFAIKPSASPAVADQDPKPNVLGPQILLLMKVVTPKWIILAIFLCFFFGPVILTLGPDTYAKIFAASPKLSSLVGFENQFTAAGKFVGAVITGIGAFIGFRRLPLRS